MAWNPELIALFTDIETFNPEYGTSALFAYCNNSAYGCTAEGFRAFVSRGADLHQIDEYVRTCLQYYIRQLHMPPGSLRDSRELLAVKYLVESGVDIFGVSFAGRTAAEYAYTHAVHGHTDLGSYAGDLRDAVMYRCGFDIAQFRTK